MSAGSVAATLAKKWVRKHVPGGESSQCKGSGERKPGTFKGLEGGRTSRSSRNGGKMRPMRQQGQDRTAWAAARDRGAVFVPRATGKADKG